MEPERVFSPVSLPFLRERVFTPPPPPTPPIPFKEKIPPPPVKTQPQQQQQHRTPPQSSTSKTRPQTPRSAPAATAVYEKDKRRTSTMIDPDMPMPPKVHQQEAEDGSDGSNENLGDLDPPEEMDKQEEKGENEVLRRGLRPLRLSNLLLSENASVESPILTSSGAVFGYSDRAGSHLSTTAVKSYLDSATYNLSNPAHINATYDDNNEQANVISRPSNGLSSYRNQTSSSVLPSAPTFASSPTAILNSDPQSLSVFNAPASSASSLSSSSSQPSQPQQLSSMAFSRPRPTSILLPPSRSTSRPTSFSAGPTQRRQSRIHYIRHVDPDPNVPIPKTAPVYTTDPAWNMAFVHSRGSLSPVPKPNLERDSNSSAGRRFDEQKAAVGGSEFSGKQQEESGSGSTSSRIPYTQRSHLRHTWGEDMDVRHHTLPPPPPPIRIPTPSQHSQSQRSSLSQSVSAESPALLFAIASDDPAEIEKVLEEAEASAASSLHSTSNTNANGNTPNAEPPLTSSTITPNPVHTNDTVGPQSRSALEFVLTNDGLRNKLDIVKVLLGYGADPLKAGFGGSSEAGNTNTNETADSDSMMKKVKSKIDDLDEATRYYLSRATSTMARKTAALLKRSTFRPLQRMRYGIVGQDRALEQLFRVLSMHPHSGAKMGRQQQPVVVFLCGPSGHGKSLLAHQFGSLLDVPIHTVDMTTLRSADELWKSYSISSSEDTVPCTLVEFLANNEGKRCVVVLDEIEKTEDARALWSLLVPWELGRCTFEANSRTIDVRNVIWVGTSNIGQDIIFSFHESRSRSNDIYTREEYVELMGILRPRVSDQLGASILSRVSAILPFVPFTEHERRVIAAEFVIQSVNESELVKELVFSQNDKEMERRWREKIIQGAMDDFILSEGARSLYRAVSSHLVDSLDEL
ncbi:hypothetical protein E1B28_008388 [Marasmius oreades]|uniref:AAA+ ATPase domain-containing protein n=1 Tax=Marasmius oreades TaxID=181124 RepID=A0A9P7RZH1_9AGAR|nr:uncharacterized protein E1B28_008388 [Marasmius oreades]KAG7092001.1 hypothetical protein E1B28_008388 [Marasmius oreades]